MNDTLRLVLSLSLSGSILALILFIIKPFIKDKLSKTIQYYIWIIVLLRLILPFSFDENIMTKVFYRENIEVGTSIESNNSSTNINTSQENNLSVAPNIHENVISGTYELDVAYFKDIFHNFNFYMFYIYLLGVIIALTINIIGYLRFLVCLNSNNKNATDKDNFLLNSLVNGRNKVCFLGNPLVNTPMLIGLFKPRIIIPDREYNEKQLRNILFHELIHLRRFDIGIKWITMITKSIHWFNPMVYIIGREINHACELSCDEAVIKNLNNKEKQEYGETLISIVSEYNNPIGVLQATMSEDKNTLKSRLLAIMNYSKKSKFTIFISGILILTVVIGGLYLGSVARKDGAYSTNEIEEENITNIPIEPPLIKITNETNLEAIENYTILNTKWNDTIYDRASFYQAAWDSEFSMLTGLHRLVPGEEITIDFGEFRPENVLVKMAYLTEDYTKSLLPIENLSVSYNSKGIYTFKNPKASTSHIKTTGRVFSIEAIWGDNICEYVFASDGKFDNNVEIKWVPVELDMEKLEELQRKAGNGLENSFIATSAEFVDSLGYSSEKAYRIITERKYDYNMVRYDFRDNESIEVMLRQPIKDGIDGIWAVDHYRIIQ